MPQDAPFAMEGHSHTSAHYKFKVGLRDRVLWADLPKVSFTPHASENRIPPCMGRPNVVQRASSCGSFSPNRTLSSFEEMPSTASGDISPSLCSSLARRSGLLQPVTLNHHRECIRKFHTVEDTSYMRTTFRRALLRKFHNVTNAWRVLDPSGHGRVSFYELCRAAQQVGFICDAQALWQCLDLDHDGFIRLEDIDPEIAHLLQDFAAVVTAKCGSADNAWRQVFTSGNQFSRCAVMPFRQAAQGVGYEGDAEAVFNALNAEKSPGGVCFEEFGLLDKWFQDLPKGQWNYRGLRPSSSKIVGSADALSLGA